MNTDVYPMNQSSESTNDVNSDSQRELLSSPAAHEAVLMNFVRLYSDLFNHDGFGDIRIEMRILRRSQKEVIIHCGKQYRYVLDCQQALCNESALKHLLKRDLLG